jgi:hypothetical protein
MVQKAKDDHPNYLNSYNEYIKHLLSLLFSTIEKEVNR